MISKISGTIDAMDGATVIISSVGGISYDVTCASSVLRSVEVGQKMDVVTEMIVREDSISLYGFASYAERSAFRLLSTVQGVGPKIALGLLEIGLGPLADAVDEGNASVLCVANGIGPKIARRIVNELRGRFSSGGIMGHGSSKQSAGCSQADVLSALLNLGFRRSEAQDALNDAVGSLADGFTFEDLLKESLKRLRK